MRQRAPLALDHFDSLLTALGSDSPLEAGVGSGVDVLTAASLIAPNVPRVSLAVVYPLVGTETWREENKTRLTTDVVFTC